MELNTVLPQSHLQHFQPYISPQQEDKIVLDTVHTLGILLLAGI
jgi:hypothetical protein